MPVRAHHNNSLWAACQLPLRVRGRIGWRILLGKRGTTRFEQRSEDEAVIGRFEPTGIRPEFDPLLKAHGFDMLASMFIKR
jgi:hypothetical protein